jgi:MFS family permease
MTEHQDQTLSQPSGARLAQTAMTSFLALFSIVGLALYGLPYFYDFMVKEFGWSRAMVTSGNAVTKLVVGPLFGFLAGWIVDRFGPRRLMLVGILMAGVALVGLSLISSVGLFYFFFLFNALGYVCGGPLPNQVLLSRWFDKPATRDPRLLYLAVGGAAAFWLTYLLTRSSWFGWHPAWFWAGTLILVVSAFPFERSRGKAMGFAYMGIGIGGGVVFALAYQLMVRFGWRGSLGALGVLVVVIAFPLAFFVRDSPLQKSGPSRPEPPAPIGQVFRSHYFYLLAAGSMCSIAAVGGTNQHLKMFLSLDQGYSQAAIPQFLSLVLWASVFGRFFMGWLADRLPKKYVMILIYLLVASAIPLLFFAADPRFLYAFAVVFGIGLGGEYMIIPLLAGELFGVRVLGRVMGVILTADGVAEATSPMLIGYLRDIGDSYNVGFKLLIGLALLGVVAISFLPKRKLA